jgi:hypothetical protein
MRMRVFLTLSRTPVNNILPFKAIYYLVINIVSPMIDAAIHESKEYIMQQQPSPGVRVDDDNNHLT